MNDLNRSEIKVDKKRSFRKFIMSPTWLGWCMERLLGIVRLMRLERAASAVVGVIVTGFFCWLSFMYFFVEDRESLLG